MEYGILQQFLRLAKEKDPRARSMLVRKVTAEYARRTGEEPSPVERELFSSLVLDLYAQIDQSVRRDIITLLARTRHVTRELAERLSAESDQFVTMLFEYSPMLSEELLLRSARDRSEQVLRAMARREHVEHEVVDALMARAYKGVVSELLRNLGADFSQNALLLLAIVCQTSLEVQSLIAARCLSDDGFHFRLRNQIEKGCPFLPTTLSRAAMEGTLDTHVDMLRSEVASLESDMEGSGREDLLVRVNLGELTFDGLLATLIEKQRKEDIVWFLKDAPELSAHTMEHLLSRENNPILGRLLAQQDVSLKTFAKLAHWRSAVMGLSHRYVYREIETYRQLLTQSERAQSEAV